MLVLHPPAEVSTSLVWPSIRFAARCTVNQEPMLVTGILVQLGQSTVYQYKAKNIPAIQAVEVACARIAVYKDMWEGSWEDFSNRPVKHVLSVLPCLNTCRSQSDCQCTGWHPTSEQPHDALLDVFRRQYFTEYKSSLKSTQIMQSGFCILIILVYCVSSLPCHSKPPLAAASIFTIKVLNVLNIGHHRTS